MRPTTTTIPSALRLLLLGPAFLCAPASATEVSGAITNDTAWTANDSPYLVIGDVSVGNSATLTVEDGVEVRFQEGLELRIGYPDAGTLVADGEVTGVLFTSDQAVPAPGDWTGIFFYSDAVGATLQGGSYVSGL